MIVAGSLLNIALYDAAKKAIESERALEEITIENSLKEEKNEKKKRKRGKKPVQKEQGLEDVSEATDSGKGSEVSVLRKKDKTASTTPRRRKPRELPESGTK